jgi:ABC-type multidrug transport system fused ATPase/permease subunit
VYAELEHACQCRACAHSDGVTHDERGCFDHGEHGADSRGPPIRRTALTVPQLCSTSPLEREIAAGATLAACSESSADSGRLHGGGAYFLLAIRRAESFVEKLAMDSKEDIAKQDRRSSTGLEFLALMTGGGALVFIALAVLGLLHGRMTVWAAIAAAAYILALIHLLRAPKAAPQPAASPSSSSVATEAYDVPTMSRLCKVSIGAPPPAAAAQPVAPLTGDIEIRSVAFRHDPSGPFLFQGLNLSIPAGSMVAVVGSSKSGKSTLTNLIAGRFTPTSGTISCGGRSLSEVDLRTVRDRIGFVSELAPIFGTTLRDNIAVNDPGAPLDRVIEASRAACLHDDVMTMPLGYHTPLVAGGGSLTAGQRQRLALARALLTRPVVLLLEEAGAALDFSTTMRVRENLARLGATCIVVARHFGTLVAADMVVVLDGGRIVAEGPHAKLMRSSGLYRDLVGGIHRSSPPPSSRARLGQDARPSEVRPVVRETTIPPDSTDIRPRPFFAVPLPKPKFGRTSRAELSAVALGIVDLMKKRENESLTMIPVDLELVDDDVAVAR